MSTAIHPHKSTNVNERFFHVRLLGHPRYVAKTVFAREAFPATWYATVAYCMRGDDFCRRFGRQVARRKFFTAINSLDGRRDQVRIITTGGPPSFDDAINFDISPNGNQRACSTVSYVRDEDVYARDLKGLKGMRTLSKFRTQSNGEGAST